MRAPAMVAQPPRRVTATTVAAGDPTADLLIHRLAGADRTVGLHIHPEVVPLRTRGGHLDHPGRHILPAAVEVPTREDRPPPGRLPPLLLVRPAAGPNRDSFRNHSSGRHFRLLEFLSD